MTKSGTADMIDGALVRGVLKWTLLSAVGVLASPTLSGCTDCLTIACFEGLAVTIIGLPGPDFTIEVGDLEGNRVITRECGPSRCFGSTLSFGSLVSESVEIAITAGAETRTQQFDVEFRDNSLGCGSCVIGEVDFIFQ